MASTIPSLVSSNLMRKSNIIPHLYTSTPRIKPVSNYKPTLILRWLSTTSPPEYSPGTPPEFPGPGHGQKTPIPTVPTELPDIFTAPEIDPGSTPDEFDQTRPDEIGPPPPWPDPLPTPGPDSPVPPLDPPRGPDIIPPPDRMPPDPPDGMPPVPPLDPPRPVDPPGPHVVF